MARLLLYRKSMMNKKTFILCVVFFALTLYAKENVNYAVNMQDGGLILKEETDFFIPISRTYRSRALDHGFFGQGWCSDFESELLFQGQGVMRLSDCQSSRPLLFKINKTASAYINSENSQDQILIKLGYYERQIQLEWTTKYNFKGKLVSFRKNNKIFKLTYNTRLLPAQIILENETANLSWHPILNLIEKISLPNKVQTFTYTGFNLVKMDMGNLMLSYQYDDLDNLTLRTTSSKKTGLSIEYDKVQDQVLKIEGDCLELYSYLKKNPKRRLSTISKTCKSLSSKTEFIFDYNTDLRRPAHITVNKLPSLDKVSSNREGE